MAEKKNENKISLPLAGKKRSWFWRTTLVLLLLTCLGIIAFSYALNRSWGVHQIEQRLAKALHTEVSLDTFHFSIFSGLSIEGLLVEDHHQDTLLYAEKMNINYHNIVAAILTRSLIFDDAAVNHCRIKIITYPCERKTNWELIFSKPEKKKQKPEKTRTKHWFDFDISINKILIEDLLLSNSNYDKYYDQSYDVPWTEIEIRRDNFKQRYYELNYIRVLNPSVILRRYPIPDSLGISTQEADSTSGTEAHSSTEITDKTTFPAKHVGFHILVDQLEISGGQLTYVNYKKHGYRSFEDKAFIDWNNLDLQDVTLSASDISLQPGRYAGKIDHLRLTEKSGLELVELCADHFISTPDSLLAETLQVYTRESEVSGDFRMDYEGYGSFKYFVDDVYMQAEIRSAHFPVKELLYFAPALYQTQYFSTHLNRDLRFKGKILGTVNTLKGRNIRAEIPGDLIFHGNISTRDITLQGEQFFSIKARPLLTSAATLADILQIKRSTERFQKLGNIAFTGQFDGFTKDFVTYGTLESDMGIAETDMRLNLKPGIEHASYSGHMSLQNFALGEFWEINDLGEVSLNAAVTSGHGLTVQTAKADLNARVLSLDYKGYQYRNLIFNGILNKSLIDGALSISEDNIDLEFKGLISDLDKTPKLDFTAKVKTLKLQPLHLNKEDIRFQGDMQVKMHGTNIDNSAGEISLHHLSIRRDTILYELNEVEAEQKIFPGGLKTLNIKSDILDARFNGIYKLTALHKDILGLLKKKHPGLYKSAHFPSYTADSIKRYYNFLIHVKNLDPILPIFTTRNIKLTSFTSNGFFDSSLDSLDIIFTTPYFTYKNMDFRDIEIKGIEGETGGQWDLAIDRYEIANLKDHLTDIRLLLQLDADSLLTTLRLHDTLNILDSIYLAIHSFPQGNGIANYFEDKSILSAGGEQWFIDPLNYAFLSSNAIDIRDFIVRSTKGKIFEAGSIGPTGLELSLTGLPTHIVDSLIHLPNLDFEGDLDLYTKIDNVFKGTGITGGVYSSDLGLKPIKLGETRVSFKMEDLKAPILLDIHAIKGKQELSGWGHLRLDSVDLGQKKGKQIGYRIHAEGRNIPVKAIQIIIPSGISEVKGVSNANISVSGIGKDKDLQGTAFIETGEARVDYTGVKYYLHKQKVIFKHNYIDFTGIALSDSLGHIATVKGGLQHSYLQHPELYVDIQSDKILGLNTTKQDNPSYYGTAIGKTSVRFTGPLKELSIDITGVAEKGTKLFIPTGYTSEEGKYRNSFIYFKDKEKDTSGEKKKEEDAFLLTVNMDLEIKEEAEVSIIFDEAAGDILQGSGIGKIHMSILPGGQITMIGDYEVVKGSYLFTLFNIVNKPFVVQPGGRIHWNGDPLNAQIDITALYENLEAPLYPLISDYLENSTETLKNTAQRPTKVDLEMRITGQLFHPEISFHIKIPNLTGPLRSYTLARLNDINSNPASLNRQVLGLIVFNVFLPPAGIQGPTPSSFDYIASLNEFFSRQFSQILTNALKQALSEVSFISDVQLNVGYKQVEKIVGRTGFSGGEFNVESTVDFSDAVRLRYKGVYANSVTYNATYLDNEVDVEIINTGVEGLRFKIYASQDHIIYNLPRLNMGFGATLKSEFDTLSWRRLIF